MINLAGIFAPIYYRNTVVCTYFELTRGMFERAVMLVQCLIVIPNVALYTICIGIGQKRSTSMLNVRGYMR